VLALIACINALALIGGQTGCIRDRHNQITDQGIEDGRLAERVREALAAGVDYKHDGVRVMAGNGVVQLSGFVKTGAQKTAAGEVASKVAGVRSVENNLAVKD